MSHLSLLSSPTMSQGAVTAAQMIPQLEAARRLALADPLVYKQIFPGIIPIVGPSAHVEVRRWVADFFAEGMASPALPSSQKEEIVSDILPTLRQMLDNAGEDQAVVKSVVQAAASTYPIVFRRVVSHPDQVPLWNYVMAMKMNILSRMESAPTGVRVCCVKFISKVVQVQTPGLIADPRRPEQNETSIALVPRNHPILHLPSLEAEASGLLDRLLTIFEQPQPDAIMIDATMNCLGVLVRTRPAVANKIISAVLNFNPLKQASTGLSPKQMIIVRSLERTTRALLRNINKHNPDGPLAPKIDSYLLRLNQSRMAIFAEAPSLKRAAPSEPAEGMDDAKRIRLTGTSSKYPPMPPPPNSFADLFSLTQDAALRAFDVKFLPADIVTTIATALLQHVEKDSLDDAVEAVKARYTHLQKVSMPTRVPEIALAGPTGIDDEDDYDPEYDPTMESITAPATEKVLDELAHSGPALDLGPFELPKPPPVTTQAVVELFQQSVGHVFGVLTSLEQQPPNRQKSGFNRLAASSNDRDAWITMLTRLATRASADLDQVVKLETDEVDPDDEDESQTNTSKADIKTIDTYKPTPSNAIRDSLFHHIISSFRPRLSQAISWLNEEWYADRLASTHDPSFKSLPNYYAWTLKLLDNLLPYLDVKDKNLLIRFLSEIPAIDARVLQRVKGLARDPERVGMCILSLQYLLMFRPPVRDLVLDAVESLWREREYEGAKEAAAKVLMKWRPEALKVESSSDEEEDDEDEGKAAGNGPNVQRPGEVVIGAGDEESENESDDSVQITTNGVTSPPPAKTIDTRRKAYPNAAGRNDEIAADGSDDSA